MTERWIASKWPTKWKQSGQPAVISGFQALGDALPKPGRDRDDLLYTIRIREAKMEMRVKKYLPACAGLGKLVAETGDLKGTIAQYWRAQEIMPPSCYTAAFFDLNKEAGTTLKPLNRGGTGGKRIASDTIRIRNCASRDRIAILDGFRNRQIRILIGAATLFACGLFPWQASAALIPSTDGATVYDTVNNVTWLANSNLAATNRFGVPVCTASVTKSCINPSGSMSYDAAAAWVAAMNSASYLGHTNWQLPTTPSIDNTGCQFTGTHGNSFGFDCAAGALGSLYYNALGLKAPDTAVPIPSYTIGPFSNFQPYYYWSQTGTSTLGHATFSFNTGFQDSNTNFNFMYVLPMIQGKLPGTPAASGTGLQVNPGGQTVYDPETNLTWLANANLAASNTFGLPTCTDQNTPKLCVGKDGAMSWDSANQFVMNMNNGGGYLGQTNWQLPPVDPSCPNYGCGGNLNPMGNLFYNQLGFSQGTPVVVAPNIAVGPFHNLQPYIYWGCQAGTIQEPCATDGPAPSFEWSFSFGNGFLGTDILADDYYVTAYFVGPPANPCTYSLSSGGQVFPASGGTGTITIKTSASCPWTVGPLPTWLTLTSSSSGMGNGTVTFEVSPNTGADLSNSFSIGGATFTVELQSSTVPGLSFIGSMPHIAAEENWTTAFTLVNKGTAAATARLSLYGDPTGTLSLPLAFPQQPAGSGPELAASLDRMISANASLIIDSAGPQTPPVQIGSAQLAATGQVDGFAIFHLIPGAQEAVVPMETRNASSYILAFDNTGGVVLGVAVENVSAQAGNVGIVIRDDTGTQIASGTIPMSANGHTSFVLSSQFPATKNKRGTVEFDRPSGGQISVLGIRTTPLGSSNTLTTIPALANVGTNGGSIAHLATGNGWQTTFVIVNTGTVAAQAHLKFFADNGAPLSIPIGPPGGAATSTSSTVDQTLAAGAMLIVQSAAPLSDPAPTIGSAQLTTNGNVGGFVIFRYNPNGQEAVVPMENRTASAYVLAFDNTNGTATGVAINTVSAQTVNIPVVVRDDMGTQIATDTLALASNGHLAFTLVTDKYPATANIRGTIEFGTPAGGVIGALGIRIPVAHTFTTLPPLAK